MALPQKPTIPRLKELRIRFRYHDGRTVDFNGVDHSFTLCVETHDPGGAQEAPRHQHQAVAPRRPRAPPRKAARPPSRPATTRLAPVVRRGVFLSASALRAVLGLLLVLGAGYYWYRASPRQ
jgi:hypothetical protein